MYKCQRCKGQSMPGIPQAKICHYRKDGNIEREDKVCFSCKEKYLNSKGYLKLKEKKK